MSKQTAAQRRKSSRIIAPIDVETFHHEREIPVIPRPERMGSIRGISSRRAVVPIDIESIPEHKEHKDDDLRKEAQHDRGIVVVTGRPVKKPHRVPICRLFCSFCLCCTMLTFGTILILLALYTGGRITDFFNVGNPPGLADTHVWDTDGEYMLNLHVINSLQDNYTAYFDRYIYEWSNGSPDVVNLSSERGSYDPDCHAYDGVMNVCNSDYGETDWRGINIIIINNGYIQNSIAKMNDFFLVGTDADQKMFTMCHEMGHGLGLPHSDENYYNADRGDCMDYTVRPQNNLHPGTYNFKLLQAMYGPTSPNATNVDGGTFLSQGVYPGSGFVKEVFHENPDKYDGENHGRRRAVETMPEGVKNKYLQAREQVEKSNEPHKKDGSIVKLVGKGKMHAHFEADLGDGYYLMASKLLAVFE
jgi:hypothetical protein